MGSVRVSRTSFPPVRPSRGRSVNLSRSAVLRGLPGANGFVLSFLTKPYAAEEEAVRCSAAG